MAFYIDYRTPKPNGETLHQIRACDNFKDAHKRLLATGFKLDESRLDEDIIYTDGTTDALLVENIPTDGEISILEG